MFYKTLYTKYFTQSITFTKTLPKNENSLLSLDNKPLAVRWEDREKEIFFLHISNHAMISYKFDQSISSPQSYFINFRLF